MQKSLATLSEPQTKPTESIVLRDLTFAYEGRQPILRELGFTVRCDGIISILGPSGVGKSTLLKLLAGVHRPGDSGIGRYQGSIQIKGQSPQSLTGPRSMSIMFQSPALLNHLSARENILLPATLERNPKQEERLEYLLTTLNLVQFGDLKPKELSGGMRTRVALARSLICEPKYLFLDEPFTGIDIVTRWRLYRFLQNERRQPDLVTVMTTHDVFEALLLANTILFVHQSDQCTYTSVLDNIPPDLYTTSLPDCIKNLQSKAKEVLLRLQEAEGNPMGNEAII